MAPDEPPAVDLPPQPARSRVLSGAEPRAEIEAGAIIRDLFGVLTDHGVDITTALAGAVSALAFDAVRSRRDQ